MSATLRGRSCACHPAIPLGENGGVSPRQRPSSFGTPTVPAWRPDVLGHDFEQTTLDLGRDSEGEVVATLVRYLPGPAESRGLFRRRRPVARDTDVLYVHGWSDYFFQSHLAEYWRTQGAKFYALDLRKYGRSLRPGQTPGYVDDLDAYDADIEAALTIMGHAGVDTPTTSATQPATRGVPQPAARAVPTRRKLVLMGHSTGGLVLSLWLARNPGRANALVLNSPWLEYQLTAAGRQVTVPALKLGSRVDPKGTILNPDLGFYNRSLSRDRGGEWDFDPEWRPEKSFPPRVGWLKAILDGHARVASGLNIDVPILTLLSRRSLFQARWSEDMRQADTVIDVQVVAGRAVKLGSVVTVAHLDGALHDVFLSAAPVRERAWAETVRWLGAYL